MPLMTWGPALQVGYGDIDVQHQRLVRLCNALAEAQREGRGRELLGAILGELARYTKLHFGFEERLMARYGLTDTDDHRREHADLTARVIDFQSRFDAGRSDVSEDLLLFLSDWLRVHILQTDRELVGQLLARGAVSAA
ncbi:MAG TPA: bacteriohemerythrin [Dermatophilaceae bacterium]|nr:bacteriohemerythrin [Dermatophilaceae bacterium]